jgi:hypothetical protein
MKCARAYTRPCGSAGMVYRVKKNWWLPVLPIRTGSGSSRTGKTGYLFGKTERTGCGLFNNSAQTVSKVLTLHDATWDK